MENSIPAGQTEFRLARMASCLERLLAPDFSDDDISWLIHRTLGTDDRIRGNELMPVTGFRTEDQANGVWERLAIELDERGIGPVNVRTDVDSIFEELALNAAQHSEAQEDCYGVVEMDGLGARGTPDQNDGGVLHIVGIVDRGIRIPASLRRNPVYTSITSDKEAILLATEMDVSGTKEQRGAGLHHVMERVRAYYGELLIISGYGFFVSREGGDPVVGDLSDDGRTFHHGTVVLVALHIPAQKVT